MHDIRLIRDDPEAFDAQLTRRGREAIASSIKAEDLHKRGLQTRLQNDAASLKALSEGVGKAIKGNDLPEANRLKFEVALLKKRFSSDESEAAAAAAKVDSLLATLPNLPASEVPDGADESANVVVHERGTSRSFDFNPREHFDLNLGLDFESAQTVAGARFAYLRGPAAQLSRALGQFMLDLHTGEFGYEEIAPPILVRDAAMFGTAQLPKFAEDSFQTTDGRWLIPTAEVSLTNLVRERILNAADLPLRFTALTPCFRSEAGAAGRDTRGLIRQHQFDKVELVSVVTPDQSEAEHERVTQAAEAVLDRLGLAYRRMLLCAGDMGFSARKTYDLEVWLPGQGKYREISSCSNCGDFQARRMDARFREPGGKPQFVHTLNGSGVAVGRALVAVLETYQEADGSVTVPEALRPYLRGTTKLEPR